MNYKYQYIINDTGEGEGSIILHSENQLRSIEEFIDLLRTKTRDPDALKLAEKLEYDFDHNYIIHAGYKKLNWLEPDNEEVYPEENTTKTLKKDNIILERYDDLRLKIEKHKEGVNLTIKIGNEETTDDETIYSDDFEEESVSEENYDLQFEEDNNSESSISKTDLEELPDLPLCKTIVIRVDNHALKGGRRRRRRGRKGKRKGRGRRRRRRRRYR